MSTPQWPPSHSSGRMPSRGGAEAAGVALGQHARRARQRVEPDVALGADARRRRQHGHRVVHRRHRRLQPSAAARSTPTPAAPSRSACRRTAATARPQAPTPAAPFHDMRDHTDGSSGSAEVSSSSTSAMGSSGGGSDAFSLHGVRAVRAHLAVDDERGPRAQRIIFRRADRARRRDNPHARSIVQVLPSSSQPRCVISAR